MIDSSKQPLGTQREHKTQKDLRLSWIFHPQKVYIMAEYSLAAVAVGAVYDRSAAVVQLQEVLLFLEQERMNQAENFPIVLDLEEASGDENSRL